MHRAMPRLEIFLMIKGTKAPEGRTRQGLFLQEGEEEEEEEQEERQEEEEKELMTVKENWPVDQSVRATKTAIL